MIRVRYRTDDTSHSISVVGHAGYDGHGNDIVCAGVSAITYALLGWLENHRDELEYLHTSVSSGDVQVDCAGGKDTRAVFEATVIGLEQIALKYPDHVLIEYLSQQGAGSREKTAGKEHGHHA